MAEKKPNNKTNHMNKHTRDTKAPRTKKALTETRKGKAKPPLPAETPPPEKEPFPIVALGASAGGLEAFEQFFKNLPSTTLAAFVVISHLDPRHREHHNGADRAVHADDGA